MPAAGMKDVGASVVDAVLVERQALIERAARPLATTPRPFVRWAGGKRRLLPRIVELLPAAFGTYYEPFAGSAALFFLLQPKRAVIGDVCRPLMEMYSAVRDDVDQVLFALRDWQVDRPTFDLVKNLVPPDRFTAAAQFIYLNKTCWNGLYRVNSRGEFNVPYGAPKSSVVVDETNLRSCAETLSTASLSESGFETSLADVTRGDLVYLDPPYVTGHNNNGFVDYNEILFSWSKQERLAEVAEDLLGRGAYVMVSNADHEPVTSLYRGFLPVRLNRAQTIAGAASARRPVTEVLLVPKP